MFQGRCPGKMSRVDHVLHPTDPSSRLPNFQARLGTLPSRCRGPLCRGTKLRTIVRHGLRVESATSCTMSNILSIIVFHYVLKRL